MTPDHDVDILDRASRELANREEQSTEAEAWREDQNAERCCNERGVKPRDTIRRIRPWRGLSMLIMVLDGSRDLRL